MLRRICLGLALTPLVGCSDDPAGPNTDPLPGVSAALVSGPVAPASAVGEVSSIRWAGTRVFVSMPPGTEAGGTSVTIRVQGSDVSVSAPMIDGGFDPVAVEAVAGHSLAITVARPSGAETAYARVPADAQPVVVRTSPRHRRVDVPLNPVIVIVFNEPMNPGTLEPAIGLSADGNDVGGTVTPVVVNREVLGAQFVPDELLAAGTTYTLEISTAAQNLAGTPLEGEVRTEFTTGSSDDLRPSGTIAFATQSGSIWSISTSQADGSGRVRIASGTGWVGQLAWSPDGERLAFSMATSVEGTHIFVMDADGSNLVRRTDTGWNQSPTWSPDGRRIAFGSLRNNRSSWGVYVTDVDGDWRDVVLIGPSVPVDPMPVWSGDGTRIAFIDASRSGEVSLMAPDGSDVSQLRSESVYTSVGRPAWSPDGVTIAAASRPGEHWWGEDIPSHLVLMATDGSGARLLRDWPGDVDSPVWSPDASILGFSNECEPGIQCIGFMAPDGRVSSITIRDAFGAAWRP